MANIEKEIEMQTNRNASKEAIVSLREKTGMSKAEFKRAIGKLLKEGAVTIGENQIKRNW